MKKLFLIMAICAGAMFFCACDEENDLLETIVGEITGNGKASIGDPNIVEQPKFTASLAMISDEEESTEKAANYVIGMGANLGIEQLLNLSGLDGLTFPFMAYRFTGVSTGTRTLSNPLTSEEILNFNYQSLFSDSFKDNFVAVAMSDSIFYVMTSGTINVTTMDENKITADFSGRAQRINRHEGVAQLFGSNFEFSGQFSSRRSKLFSWLASK